MVAFDDKIKTPVRAAISCPWRVSEVPSLWLTCAVFAHKVFFWLRVRHFIQSRVV